MTELKGMEGLADLPRGAAVSVGNFDGLHLGHRRILRRLIETTATGTAVVTFEPHPLTVLNPPATPPRLTPWPVKRALLAAAGVSHVVTLAPTPDVLGMSAEAFWATLRDAVAPVHLVEGATFTFGRGRVGTVDRLRQWAERDAVRLTIVESVDATLPDCQLVRVSSSVVRWFIAHGRVREAAACLGRPYALRGTVVEGKRRGRTIGFPTANLECGEQLLPGDGVYVGRSRPEHDGPTYPVALSVGTNPTFGDVTTRVAEAHLIGYAPNEPDGLYCRTLTVELLDWVRATERFGSLEALRDRLSRDVTVANRVTARTLS